MYHWIVIPSLKHPNGFSSTILNLNQIVKYPIVHFLGGKNNDKIIFLGTSPNFEIDVSIKVIIFDTTSKQWETNRYVLGEPKGGYRYDFGDSASWVSDEKTGLAYRFNSVDVGMVVFDSINLAFVNKSVSNPRKLFNSRFVDYDDYAQVLLPSGKILYIGGWTSGSIGIRGNKHSMSNILTYDIMTDTWQMMVWKSFKSTSDKHCIKWQFNQSFFLDINIEYEPEGCLKHTAVSSKL